MLRRATKDGSTSGQRMITRAKKTFEQALRTSSEAEDVMFDGQTYRALVIMKKDFGDGADKRIICTPFETPLTTGKLVYVPSTGRQWLTFNPELRNKSYNRFMVKEVNETITWRSRNNEVFQTGAVVGTLTGENVLVRADDRFGYWKNSERVYCYIPESESTEFIEVDRNIVMNDETWKVLAVNSIQEEGVLALQLTKWKNDDMINQIPEIQIIGPNKIQTFFGTEYEYALKGLDSSLSYEIEVIGMTYTLLDNILTAQFEEDQLGAARIAILLDGEEVASLEIELLPPY